QVIWFSFYKEGGENGLFRFLGGGGGVICSSKSHFTPFFCHTNYNFSYTGLFTSCLQNTQSFQKCGIAKLKGDSKPIFKPMRVKVA
ncbi:hypothetical protein, partial [Helicobacter sp. UBA3407]|uniref:hypothetical protein n=2 Tax=Helicobacteraceae TaxID=72293 RepID=UPI00262AE1E5